MKVFVLLLSILGLTSPLPLFAGQGVVISWEAPLFDRPHLEAKIIQRHRKGEVIYIHNAHFYDKEELNSFYVNDPFDVSDLISNQDDFSNKMDKLENLDFYITMDNNGMRAFTPKRFIKLIFKDAREEMMSTRLTPHDPTDYRPPEPLPPHFPTIKNQRHRFIFSYGKGTQDTQSYAFAQRKIESKSPYTEDFSFFYGKSFDFSTADLLYGGLNLHYQMARSTHSLEIDIGVVEKKRKIGLGPYISYDLFRKSPHQVSLIGSFLIYVVNHSNYEWKMIRAKAVKRRFSTYTFAPKVSLYYQLKTFINELDFIVGPTFQINPPHTLKARPTDDIAYKNPEHPDQISKDWNSEISVLIGVQLRTPL